MAKLNREKVEYWLRIHTHLKDDDFKLMATIWLEELGGIVAANDMSARDFLTLFAGKELMNPQTIIRTRAKLQEEQPELRGLSYRGRQAEGVSCKSEFV